MIENDDAIFTEREDGILHVHFKEGLEITVEVLGRMFDVYNDICQGEKRPFLFTAAEHVSFTAAARENAIVMQDSFPGLACAVLVQSLGYKIIANFYLKVNKPTTPYQVFSKEEEAIKWLQGFLQKG